MSLGDVKMYALDWEGSPRYQSIEANTAAQIEQMIKPTSVTLTIGEPVTVVES
jgi:hypothetical protein